MISTFVDQQERDRRPKDWIDFGRAGADAVDIASRLDDMRDKWPFHYVDAVELIQRVENEGELPTGKTKKPNESADQIDWEKLRELGKKRRGGIRTLLWLLAEKKAPVRIADIGTLLKWHLPYDKQWDGLMAGTQTAVDHERLPYCVHRHDNCAIVEKKSRNKRKAR
jgi:hypothetical protein